MFKAIVRSILLCSAFTWPALVAAAPNSVHFDRPLVFEPNLGQQPAQVSFTARAPGYQLFLTPSGASIVIAEPVADSSPSIPGHRPLLRKAKMSVVGMNLAGSHAWSEVHGLQPTGGSSNYLMGNDQKEWHRGIPQYGRVQVDGVYDGIDLVFYGHGRDLEYDFVVSSGGDPNQIRLAFGGADSIRVDDKTGDLVVKTSTGFEMRHVQPKVYQQVGDRKVEVAGSYQILDNGQVAFRLGAYDRRNTLVIDPAVLEFFNYLHGSEEDEAYSVAVDRATGNSYVTGQTFSTDFPNSVGGQVAKNCPQNVCPAYIFVAELGPLGVLHQSTLIGGSDIDYVGGIAQDATGVWVSGTTSSPNFSTHTQFGHGFWNGFVAKLTPDLSHLDWCVTFGGAGGDQILQGANAIAVDANHAAYVTGETGSVDFPTSLYTSTTLKPKQKAYAGGHWDAFVVKVGADGYLNSGYSTYLGGLGVDEGLGIALDSVGHAYVTGVTSSLNFPVNGATSHGSPKAGGTVAFVTELSMDGSRSLYSEILGGTKTSDTAYPFDGGEGIAVDATGEAYLTGYTCSSDFPTSAGALQRSAFSPCAPLQTLDVFYTAFVTKLSNTGALLYSTYLGGIQGSSIGYSIGFDQQQDVYVGGATTTGIFPGLPATNIILPPGGGFVCKLHPMLETVGYSVLLGNEIYSLAVYQPTSSKREIIVAGDTFTPTATDTFSNNELDGFVGMLSETN